MLVRKCDLCNHIIGDEIGYMVEIYRTSMPRGATVRNTAIDTTVEICSECAQAIYATLNERMTFEKKEEQETEK